MTPEALARLFHDTYERLAPDFGYETRPETRAFDPTTPNGRLMVAVCAQVLAVTSRPDDGIGEPPSAWAQANHRALDTRPPTSTP
jgi:hypothetical protein